MITKVSTSNHEEWVELRKGYLGGSDAAAIVGLNRFCSPFELWAEKTGKKKPFEGNLATDVGTFLEEFIGKRFEIVSGKKVRRANQSIFNDKYPFAIANIDRDIVGEDSALECKSTSTLCAKRFKGGEFPERYYVQCVHYLAVTEKKRWYLAVLIGNSDFKIYQITRISDDSVPEWCESSVYVDDEEIQTLMTVEADFWEKVKNDIVPVIDGSDSCGKALFAMYPRSTDDCIDLSSLNDALESYIKLGAEIKTLETKREEAANRIKLVMGEAGKGECEDFFVSWKSTERSSFDNKTFAKDHPDMDLSNYYKKTSYRTFKVTERI